MKWKQGIQVKFKADWYFHNLKIISSRKSQDLSKDSSKKT